MDVIGDVPTAEPRGVDEIRKAQEQAERGRNIGTAAWATLFLSLGLSFFAALKTVELQRQLGGSWTWYGPAIHVVLAVFFPFALFTRSFYHLWESHNEKNRLMRYLQNADQEARNDLLRHSRFIGVFRPPQGEIDRVLTAAAFVVLTAHRDMVEFQRRGMGTSMMPAPPEDPEEAVRSLEMDARARKEELNAVISRALHNFRYPRDLAKALDYQVHESWKEYIPPDILPRQLKKGVPGPAFSFPTQPGEGDASLPVFAEGANEQPGQ